MASPIPCVWLGSGDVNLPTAAIAALAAAHLFDFGSFLIMTSRHGLAAEFNPLVVGLAQSVGRPGLTLAKFGAVVLLGAVVVVTTLPVTDAGEVILLRRGIEPGYGAWAQPGGFLEIDETAEEGAIRETLEETGLIVETTGIVGIYTRPPAAAVVIAFTAGILGGAIRTGPEALDIVPFLPEEIPWEGIGFRTTTWALRDWIRVARPELAELADAALEPEA